MGLCWVFAHLGKWLVGTVEKQLGSIEKQLKLLLASGIANVLACSSHQKSTDSMASIDSVVSMLWTISAIMFFGITK